jgi:arylsulfatase A
LFFHYPHYYETTTPVSAVRAGRWKLLEYLEDQRVELFDLAADPSEQNDLAAQEPERARELRQRLHAWRESVGAAMPKPNPEFKPKR